MHSGQCADGFYVDERGQSVYLTDLDKNGHVRDILLIWHPNS